MTIQLTEQQQQALDAASTSPVRVIDPRTQAVFVLVPAEAYERLLGAAGDEDDLAQIRAMYPHIWNVMKEDWDDPAMDVYDSAPPKDDPA
jgi:hypothetical protein